MSQTKKRSWQEAVTNTAIGYGIGVAGQMVIFPILGYDVPLSDNLILCLFFTGISVLRNYVIRRFFDNIND